MERKLSSDSISNQPDLWRVCPNFLEVSKRERFTMSFQTHHQLDGAEDGPLAGEDTHPLTHKNMCGSWSVYPCDKSE